MSKLRRLALAGGAAVGLAATGYLAMVALAWARFGHPRPPRAAERDDLLDRFIPRYDVVERHSVLVRASTDITMAAAADMDLQASWIIRAIFRTRELVLGTRSSDRRWNGLVPEMLSIGWGVLADVPGHELVMGAVTQPWRADVVFRSLSPEAFRDFNEPGYVKIVWTLRADPAAGGTSVFRTETRAVATDEDARRQFRWYWARFSPGIALIRTIALGPMKADAERRAGQSR